MRGGGSRGIYRQKRRQFADGCSYPLVTGIGDYAVVYDITCDRERRRVDKLMKGFGFRIQKSVFECRLDRRGKAELIEQLGKLGLKTGFVKIYRLEYSSKNEVVGDRKGESIDEGNAFVV